MNNETSFNTAGRIGKAWGLKAARSYTPDIGWTDETALDKARHHAASALMRAYMQLPKSATYVGRVRELSRLDRDAYEDYRNLYSRLDRELVKAYRSQQGDY